MTLKEKLNTDLRAAMLAKDALSRDTIRLLRSEISNIEIDKGPLDEAGELALLSTQAKRRRESIEAFRAGGRDELADKEEAELAIIQRYLPAPLSEAEVTEMARTRIADLGATSMRDMGRVMGAMMPELRGKFHGGQLKTIVQNLLKASS